MSDSKIVFGKMLDYYRKERNMTMEELGKALGKTPSTISRWISGERSPKMYEVESVTKLFNTDVETLLFGPKNESENVEQQNPDTWFYDYYDRDIAAGALSLVDGVKEDEVKEIEIADTVMGRYAGQSNIFFTRVNGRSMDKFIPDHSLIAVKRLDSFHQFCDDDIVLFSYENGYSIKRFYNDEENKQLIFSSESTVRGFHDIVVPYENTDDLELVGKVVLYIVNVD